MKKIITFIFAICLITGISSCSKETSGCTDPNSPNYNSFATSDDGSCEDLTTSIVGTYIGDVRVISATTDTIFSQTVSVTKIDNQTIQVEPEFNSNSTTFTAVVTKKTDGFTLNINSRNAGGGVTVTGNPNCSGCSSTSHGAYQAGTFVYSVVINGGIVATESFLGTK